MIKRNYKEEAYESILQMILSMKIKPGESITENALQNKLKIGRTPIREALARLESEGLIYSKKGRKTVYTLTIDVIEEIFDVKYALEGAMVNWAATRGSAKDKDRLSKIVDDMHALTKNRPDDEVSRKQYLDNWLKLDKKLHDLIYHMAKSTKATQFLNKLNLQWHRMKISIYALEGRISRSVLEYDQLVTCIVKGQGDKAETMVKEHIESLRTEIITSMRHFYHYI